MMVGNTIYNLGNRVTGVIPLMGIYLYGFSTDGGSGGCILNNTYITMVNGNQVQVQDIKVGDKILSYNYTTGQFLTAQVSNISISNTTNIIDVNNGLLFISGFNVQPILVKLKNGITEIIPVGQLNYGMEILMPLLHKWIPITSITLKTGSFTVYDIKIVGGMDYIANGILVIQKETIGI